MRRDDFILIEVFSALIQSDEYVRFARKSHPLKWLFGILLSALIGTIQMLLWVLTIIPSAINKWVLSWRYI